MSLKPCRECGQGVSTEVMKCPHCHVKWPHMSEKQRGCAAGCALLGGLVFLIAMVGALIDAC